METKELLPVSYRSGLGLVALVALVLARSTKEHYPEYAIFEASPVLRRLICLYAVPPTLAMVRGKAAESCKEFHPWLRDV